MRPLSVAALSGVLLVLALLSAPVRGQTPPSPNDTTPVPTLTATVTPTPGPPSAQDLLAATQAAQQAAGSAHFTETDKSVDLKVERSIEQVHGDESFTRPLLLHAFSTGHDTKLNKHPQKTTVTHTELIAVGSSEAVRTNGGPWKCVDLTQLIGALSQLFGSSDAASGITIKYSSPVATVVGSTAVWRVQVKIDIPGLTPKGQPAIDDYYIEQSNNLLLRETTSLRMSFSVKVKGKKKHLALQGLDTIKYSSYGEPLDIKLPAPCGGTLAAASARRPAIRAWVIGQARSVAERLVAGIVG